jgi:hypothetical protein
MRTSRNEKEEEEKEEEELDGTRVELGCEMRCELLNVQSKYPGLRKVVDKI